jgi:hypothetical protein
VDSGILLVLACAAAGCSWLLLVGAIAFGRLRAPGRRPAPPQPVVLAEWPIEGAARQVVLGDEPRFLLERGLRSPERDVRVAAITALGRLGARHEWAVDGLIEALATEADTPARVAAELDRLAPRPGARLAPLLGHPSDVVRFYAVRLLAGYPELARNEVVALAGDRSPNVRAAAIETLRATGSPSALRMALARLGDTHPSVRAQAIRTASALGVGRVTPFVARRLEDDSWWVRETAREALATSAGGGAAEDTTVEQALRSGIRRSRPATRGWSGPDSALDADLSGAAP